MDQREAFNLVVLLILLLAFYRTVNGADNELRFWHLLSSRSVDGKIFLDNDKVGQLTGLLFGTWIVCWLAYTNHLTIYYFGSWLLYASGMGAFSKFARGFIQDKYGKKETQPAQPQPAMTSVTSPDGTTTKTIS